MKKTIVDVSATPTRAPVNAAGDVITDSFFAPAETDLIDSLLGRYRHLRKKLADISATIREGENGEAVEYFLRGNVRSSRMHMPPVRVVFDMPGALASLNADF